LSAFRRAKTELLEMRKRPKPVVIIVLGAAIALSCSACNRGATSDNEQLDTSTYRPLATPANEFDQKLQLMRDAHFQHVWVFRRLDGKEFNSEDSEHLHANAPRVVDWIGLDDRKTFIAGSNIPLSPENLAALQKRYKVEDYSGK
jgi:hypothetical protein